MAGTSPAMTQQVARIERSEIRGKHVRLKCRSRVSLRSTQATMRVIPALVAGIHVFLGAQQTEDVDGRDKPGHDVVASWRERR
jgi:hypothetical protein